MNNKTLKSLLAAAVLLACAAVSPGCAAGKGQLNPVTGVYNTQVEGDVFVVNAQRTRGVALEVFDGFMKWERQNEAKLLALNPAIHKAADEVRTNGAKWLNDLSSAISAYQSNRSEDGKFRINQALAVIATTVASAQQYMAAR